MKKWFLSAKKADFNEIAKKYHIDPVIAKIIVNRKVDNIDKYLYGSVSDMYSPFLMKDMDKAVSIIKENIKIQSSFRIIGDYDVDGVTSTAILYKKLLSMGAKVDYVIPHRVEDGYGLNIRMIEDAVKDNVNVIITCDNGITAVEQIRYAKEQGIIVIVTDHHEVPYKEDEEQFREYILPVADAIINPKQIDCNYPFKGLCGAVVAYKLVQALSEKPLPNEYLALAAFGTICDVMELVDENRIIVKTGLKLMTENNGIKALMMVNGMELKELSVYHIGFILGPCVNASGRLDTAKKAVELLCMENVEKAVPLAEELKKLNDERKELTTKGVDEAVKYIEENKIEESKVFVVVLNCHESIAGIIAGKIRERYNRPILVLTRNKEECKGSGRSIPAYDMFAELTKCKHLLDKFGGHKLAAGLSLKEDKVRELRKLLNQNCSLKEEDFEEKVIIDVPMPLSYVTEELIEQFKILEPFGVGNEKPVFAQKDISFISGQILGKNRNVGKYCISDGSRNYTLMNFGTLDNFSHFIDEKYGVGSSEKLYSNSGLNAPLSVLYYPSINEFRGIKSIQFIMQDYC